LKQLTYLTKDSTVHRLLPRFYISRSITFAQQLYKEMPIFYPFNSCTLCQLYTNVIDLVVCCITFIS